MAYQPPLYTEKVCNHLTIKDFVTEFLRDVELTPIEQRMDVQKSFNETKRTTKETKRQGIINSIFKGLDIGEVSFYTLTDDDKIRYEDFYEIYNVKPNAVHDGGHRSRSILAYVQNKFPTHKDCPIGAKFYSELTKDELEYFQNYQLRLLIYKNSSPAFRGLQFEQAGKSTALNEQEILNGFGNILIANLVRDISRELGAGINNTPHSLFDVNTDCSGNIKAVYLSKGPDRLSYDRFVARIVYLAVKDSKPGPCDDDELRQLYRFEFSKEQIDKVRIKTSKALDFLLGVAKAKKRATDNRLKLNLEEMTMLMRLYFEFQTEHRGGFKIENYDDFYYDFSKAMTAAINNGTLIQAGSNSTHGKLFEKYLRSHKELKIWRYTVDSLKNAGFNKQRLIDSGVMRVKSDGPRLFTSDDVHRKWIEQDQRDWVDGKKLSFAKAVGGHLISHANGGKTEYTNLIVTSDRHNREMGSMNADDYKKMIMDKMTA